jgi:hypothetical protein
MSVWTGIAMLVIALVLIFVGLPNKEGVHPRLLRFNAAVVIYPPLILVFIAWGLASIVASLGK